MTHDEARVFLAVVGVLYALFCLVLIAPALPALLSLMRKKR